MTSLLIHSLVPDISVAGKQEGMIKGKTRSGLLYECERIIEHCRPKYLLLENVKNLVGKKFKPQFDEWLAYLESLGYTSYWKVLNAKDYGVPQNRERVFVVSILGEHEPYKFADKIPLDKCVADILEDEVDEKYYLSKEIQDRFVPFPADRLNNDSIEVFGTTAPNPYNKEGKLIYDKCTSAWVYNPNKCMSTLSARDYKQPKQIAEVDFRIRKLTPRECFRLMGMRDDDIDKIQDAGISNTQQYKMAGNSIVVNVLEAIFKKLFLQGEYNEQIQRNI